MTTLYIAFTDESGSAIASFFSGPQDKAGFPYQATIESSDPKWKAFYDSVPEMMRNGLPEPDSDN